ncbi:MAG: 8-amino-7-oxononanoate synthase [Candidatus Omnitrophica bacterium]|nr:8-amino-7-oxononanoate synthase [Candidatus Omnitrophota bacterium]
MRTKKIWYTYFRKRIRSAKNENLYRSLPLFDTFQPGYLIRNGKRCLNLCANDYLGLAADSASQEEGRILAEILPAGSGASRLVTGNLVIHQELEKLLAEWKRSESALVFPSGYQTNVGVISCLAGRGDAIFSDKWNHASIVDGCLLSGAAFYRYHHADLDELAGLLKSKGGRKNLIITDGVFSMDGDIAPLEGLSQLARESGALLLVDDAHGTGVLGPDGSGSLAHQGIDWQDHILIMGTLSKAIGAQGGFICGSKTAIEYLVNYCRAFIYSTGISPWLAGVAHSNISRIRSDSSLIERLRTANQTLREALRDYGIPVPDSPAPILPILLGDSRRALRCSKALMAGGIVAAAIRPPTVPEGSSRIRLSLCAAHALPDLVKAARTLAKFIQSNPD